MTALILNGALELDETLTPVLRVIDEEFRAHGFEVDICTLREMDIAPCLGCFGCWERTPGVCLFDDAARDVTRKMIQSKVTVLLTPITFGGYSSELKKAVDRLIPNILPFFTQVQGETHHEKRYTAYPALVGIGVQRQDDPEEEKLFRRIVKRNALNMRAPGYSTCVLHGTEVEYEMRTCVVSSLKEAGVIGE